MSSRRVKRVQQLLKKEISELIQKDLKDPKLGMVTVTDVELTNDLSLAKVFLTVYGEDGFESETLKKLRKASGFIKGELSRKIRLRQFPEIRFMWDSSIEHGIKIESLLEKIERERKTGRSSRDT